MQVTGIMHLNHQKGSTYSYEYSTGPVEIIYPAL